MCSINFNRNHYCDKVKCDVVDIGACHLLLGRPWKFDKDVHHGWKKHLYFSLVDQESNLFTIFTKPNAISKYTK